MLGAVIGYLIYVLIIKTGLEFIGPYSHGESVRSLLIQEKGRLVKERGV